MTNDAGEAAVLSHSDYQAYLSGALDEKHPLFNELLKKDFLRDGLDLPRLAERAVERHLLSWTGANVHTLVVTRRCNFKCAYCHASVVGEDDLSTDMPVDTARRAVDLAFQSPSPTLMLEFQGGEPLLNWPVVKFVVEYAAHKNKLHKRSLHFGLISNFSLLDDEKLDWLVARGVSFCTSLDGPADVHNGNRIYLGGNTHAEVTAGLRKIQARRKAGAKIDAPNAICTVTRQSFGRHKEIVDQLVELGLERVQFGPLDPIGFARKSWGAISYTSEEFVRFYAQALDYLIELNQKGVKAYEKMALIFVIRILQGGHWRFPNADGLARLAYNHDGAVYTCEDGRLLAAEGDGFFKIGDVRSSSYTELLEHPTVRASTIAALPQSQPQCFFCAYSPFCTVMPVHNYQTQGSLFGRMPDNGWCEKMMGLFDVIFERLQDPRSRTVLESWLEYKDR
jgi:His-Xaa-Ser system radical SAM maturase HxsB